MHVASVCKWNKEVYPVHVCDTKGVNWCVRWCHFTLPVMRCGEAHFGLLWIPAASVWHHSTARQHRFFSSTKNTALANQIKMCFERTEKRHLWETRFADRHHFPFTLIQQGPPRDAAFYSSSAPAHGFPLNKHQIYTAKRQIQFAWLSLSSYHKEDVVGQRSAVTVPSIANTKEVRNVFCFF